MSHEDRDPTSESRFPTAADARRGDESRLTAIRLLRDGVTDLRRTPSVLLAMVLAGLAVAVVDWVRLVDPAPVTEFVGLTGGRVTIHYGVMVTVVSGTSTPLSALAGLRPAWLAWVVGLELLRNGALVLAGVYGFATLLDVDATASATLRYAGVFGVFAALRAFFPTYSVGLVAGVLFIALFLFVVVRLVALPALLVTGASVSAAVGRSWRLAAGHGWSLLGVVAVVGLASFGAASVPVAGPVLASIVTALQVAVVAAFVRRANGGGSATRR
ncbi:hypothetical protein [Halosimplex salinum]|uniref:hypothetical protein n=1 Tax=Halosimplex salinum TaxID=1710538 RepID=UPI000F46E85A|nr:hypothetical protein [Halosimplex salinum]